MKRLGVLLAGGPFKKEDFNPIHFNNTEINFYSLSSDYDPSEIEIIVGYKINRELLWSLPNLKLVHLPFAGVDILDLSLIRERGIYLSNSHANAKPVAEFAVSLLFSLVKKIPEFDRYMRRGVWKGRWEKDILDDFYGKYVTILGFGSIGREIASMLKAFGMKIFGIKRKVSESDTRIPGIEKIETMDEAIEFLKKSHFLIISLPLTKETENIVNKEMLDALGYGYLVNISRGKIVDEEILYGYLKEGKLKGAALDVWWIYPKRDNPVIYPSHFPFWELDNVIMTPHTAGVTQSFLEDAKKEVICIVKDLTMGRLPKNLVDISKGY